MGRREEKKGKEKMKDRKKDPLLSQHRECTYYEYRNTQTYILQFCALFMRVQLYNLCSKL